MHSTLLPVSQSSLPLNSLAYLLPDQYSAHSFIHSFIQPLTVISLAPSQMRCNNGYSHAPQRPTLSTQSAFHPSSLIHPQLGRIQSGLLAPSSLQLSPQHFSGFNQSNNMHYTPSTDNSLWTMSNAIQPVSQSSVHPSIMHQSHQIHSSPQHQSISNPAWYASVSSPVQFSGQQITASSELNTLGQSATAQGDSIRMGLAHMNDSTNTTPLLQSWYPMQQSQQYPSQMQMPMQQLTPPPQSFAAVMSQSVSSIPLPGASQLLQSNFNGFTGPANALSHAHMNNVYHSTFQPLHQPQSQSSHSHMNQMNPGGIQSNGFSAAPSSPLPQLHMRSSHSHGYGNGHKHGQFSSPVLLVTLIHRDFSDDPSQAYLIPRMKVSQCTSMNATRKLKAQQLTVALTCRYICICTGIP
jgi:hypothetical protein